MVSESTNRCCLPLPRTKYHMKWTFEAPVSAANSITSFICATLDFVTHMESVNGIASDESQFKDFFRAANHALSSDFIMRIFDAVYADLQVAAFKIVAVF